MEYYLTRLKFTGPVRFGPPEPGVGLEKNQYWAHADTFFSALSLELLRLHGPRAWKELWEAAGAGELLVSDLMPYAGSELCVPRPAFLPQHRPADGEAGAGGELEKEAAQERWKKKVKDLKFIPLNSLDQYLKWLWSGGQFPLKLFDFGRELMFMRVALRQGGESLPYYVSAYCFAGGEKAEAGLYFAAGFSAPARDRLFTRFFEALDSLGHSGIGGKRTAGFGRFELEDDPALLDGEYPVYGESDLLLGRLLAGTGTYYLALSPVIPSPDEFGAGIWEDAYYTLLPRRGFALAGTPGETPLKKKPVVALAPGSCLRQRLPGRVCDVTPPGYSHRVYRYGKGMYLALSPPEVKKK